MEFDKFFLSLRLRCPPRGRNRRHTEDERQTLRCLILKIWTIFKTMQMTSNDAHAEVYISVFNDCHIYQKRELFTCYS